MLSSFIFLLCILLGSKQLVQANKSATIDGGNEIERNSHLTRDHSQELSSVSAYNNNNNSDFNVDAILTTISSACNEHCAQAADYSADEQKCGPEVNLTNCAEKRCLRGCRQWWRALQDYVPCPAACTSAQFQPYDMMCISACYMAVNYYWTLMQSSLQARVQQLAPFVTYENDSTEEIHIKWDINLPTYYLFGSPSSLEYQVGNHNSWSKISTQSCSQTFECAVNASILTETAYKFRFVLNLAEDFNRAIYSPASEILYTKAHAVPTTAPILKQCMDLDLNHLACFWQSSKQQSSVLSGYKLQLQTPDNQSIVNELLPWNVTFYIFENLMVDFNYTLKIAIFNEDGIGPFAKMNISPRIKNSNKSYDLINEFNSMLLAGEYSIKLKTLQPLIETKAIFESDQLISDYALHLTLQCLFVVTAHGNVERLYLNDSPNRKTLKLNVDKPLHARKITLDWINQRLFIAGQLTTNDWSIISTDYELKSIALVATNLTQSIEQLDVDPINGWLFWRTETSIQRLNLATNVTSDVMHSAELGYFRNDYARYLLLVYNKTNNSLLELSYDGSYRRSLSAQPFNFSQTLFGEINNFFYSEAQKLLVLTNGTHFNIENESTNEYDTIDITRDLEWCWSIMPMSSALLQPLPTISNRSPTKFQAIFSSNMAKISWLAPPLNLFQTTAAYQQWEYELEIMDVASNNAFNIRNIHTSYFNVEKLQSNNVYTLRVRTMGVKQAGPWSEPITARTWPQEQYKFLWATSNGLYETNELGLQQRLLSSNKHIMSDIVQINSTIYYIDINQQLMCVNIMNPEINCSSFSANNLLSLGYDWRGGKLYWSDLQRNLVIRCNLDGTEREFLPIFGARYIQLDAYGGHIYYTNEKCLKRRALSGASNLDELQYYCLNADDDTMLGFTLDPFQRRLFWLVLTNETEIILFTTQMNVHQQRNLTILSNEQDIALNTLQYVAAIDSLMWLNAARNAFKFLRLEHMEQQLAVLELKELGTIYNGRLKSEYVAHIDNAVIPEIVENSSIVLDNGYWNDFNIKWNPAAINQDYAVYYKLILKFKLPSNNYEDIMQLEVSDAHAHLVDLPQPQLLLKLSITPCSWWICGAATNVTLRTPAAAQAEPKRLRVYLEKLDTPFTSNITAYVRWDPPENISVNALASYKVYCWLDEQIFAERLTNYSSDKPLETVIGNLEIDKTYIFQVQAFAPGHLEDAERTANFSLHVNPEVQAVPKLLFATSEFIAELDLDLKTRNKLAHTTSSIENMAFIRSERRLLWVNENVELISCIIGSTSIKLARMRAEVISLTVDWISRIVYWAELELDREAVGIYKLDLCQFEGRVMTGTRLLGTEFGRIIKDLVILPFSQTLLWLEFEHGAENAILTGRNLKDLTKPLKFKEMALLRLFAGDLSIAEMETVNLMDFKGKLCSFDVHRQLCTSLKLNLLSENVLRMERDNGYIYALRNDSIRGYNRRKQNLEFHYEMNDVSSIKAFNYQSYPEKKCLLPQFESAELYEDKLQPMLQQREETYMVLQLPNVNKLQECSLNVPGLKYIFSVFDTRLNYTKNITSSSSSSSLINITQLQAFTEYKLQMKIVSYYQQKLEIAPLVTNVLLLSTAPGVPSIPLNFSAIALSPTEIYVSWNAPQYQPCAKVWYQTYWHVLKEESNNGAFKKTDDTNTTLSNLEPNTMYNITLQAYCTPTKYNSTPAISVITYRQPEELQLMESNPSNLTLSWLSSENLTQVVLVCRALNGDGENEFSIDITQNVTTNITVTGLQPKTKYDFYLELSYPMVSRPYQWPQRLNEHYVFETIGTTPSAPGQPQIELITGEIFKIFWSAAADNGAPIIEYSLEALQARKPRRKRRNSLSYFAEQTEQQLPKHNEVRKLSNRTRINILSELPWADEPEPIEDKWLVYCNTSELSCIVRDMHTLRLLMFRVRARNEPYGWGPYSADSEHVQEPFLSPGKRDSLVLAILAPAAIVSSCVIVLVILRMIKTRRLRAKKLLEKSRPSIWSNLSAMQQHQIMMSRHRALSVASHHSTLYNGGPLSDADIALLPHISWNQITLLKFLGSGAFGEVYEGLVKYDDEDEPERVAIKSLRKGASEFSELLQEAQLMSNFRHENIVRLVGVCCDTESISIIMEHMEGGDLLNYLRESRPNSGLASLELIDLILMCLDVAKGCCYLEEMHFVHRDLACRNCLVLSREPSRRTVKIGDFGLARDIYKSDYYRKEGEGLLPVRWMSPESLVDGIFTTQTDVWAFAVLCWEILTYGQQPYAARNNFEVLNYVTEGGRLDQPTNCPDKLFSLLLQCWRFDPEERPSFARCVDTLNDIKRDIRRVNVAFRMEESEQTPSIYVNTTQNFAVNGFAKKLSNNQLEMYDRESHISLTSDCDAKSDMKALCEPCHKSIELENISDESQLMVFKLPKENKQNNNNTSANINMYEGVSKL